MELLLKLLQDAETEESIRIVAENTKILAENLKILVKQIKTNNIVILICFAFTILLVILNARSINRLKKKIENFEKTQKSSCEP